MLTPLRIGGERWWWRGGDSEGERWWRRPSTVRAVAVTLKCQVRIGTVGGFVADDGRGGRG
jgi:hypothetical protein